MNPAADVTNEELSVHLCGPDDRAEQARLFNACFSKGIDADGLAWRYDRNPHGSAISLLSRPPGGEGICGYACSPRLAVPFGDGEQAAPIGQTGDVMTHPDWRKRGIFSGLDRACMDQARRIGWPATIGLPNRRSAHIFVDLGWERVGIIRPWTLVLRADRRARAVRRTDGRLRSAVVPLAALRARTRRRALRGRAHGLQVRPLERFPQQVADLSRVEERRHTLMVRRDAAYLDWRFLSNTAGLHRALGVSGPDGEWLGYSVVQVPREGSAVGFLVDLLAPGDAAAAAAMEGGLSLLESGGASVVQATAVEGSSWERRLVDAGFQPPRPQNHLIVIAMVHLPDHPLARAVRSTEGWYLTDGDRDDETMG
ncbi:MAG: GNAT family N-acetyltransferase [Planctomycetota bacterium]|jgi:GNAT superfamily N-acetyltransferase|nr:GNAT family N-acetyltransferase [Planctomycetota bacterium]MDP6762775.1 GNAT family N-acetyltransferase [Planctomycetota bacterium]MDP6990386.1 GNAT family N-acetyltransferase [Planctomycetota bacterium]